MMKGRQTGKIDMHPGNDSCGDCAGEKAASNGDKKTTPMPKQGTTAAKAQPKSFGNVPPRVAQSGG